MLALNTVNTTSTAGGMRALEGLLYNVAVVGIPVLAWYLSKNPYWVGAVPILDAIVSFAKQKGWLPTTLSVQPTFPQA